MYEEENLIKKVEGASLLFDIIRKCKLPFKRKMSPKKARGLIRKVFEANNKNLSKTPKILGVSRHT